MQKNIFNVYVVMDSQATCDRMKQVCIDNGLDIHDFTFRKDFHFANNFCVFDNTFGLWAISSQTQVTEQEFMNLLKEYKDEQLR